MIAPWFLISYIGNLVPVFSVSFHFCFCFFCCFFFLVISVREVRNLSVLSEKISCKASLLAMNFISVSFLFEKVLFLLHFWRIILLGIQLLIEFNFMYVNAMNLSYVWFLWGIKLNWFYFTWIDKKCFWTTIIWIKFHSVNSN